MKNNRTAGSLAALVTIVIWGTTFISTKVLLVHFQPVEILLFRFVLGLGALLLFDFRPLKTAGKKQELVFAAAGLCGICLYYLLENIALTYTLASNVGVIISVAPFFTAILSHIFLHEKRPGKSFFAGFILAIAGICLISFNGTSIRLSPVGDLLALLAAFVWACYSVLTKKISEYGYSAVQSTRQIFCWGILFMLPLLPFLNFRLDLSRLGDPVSLLNLLYLGFGASALCFVTWNYAVSRLGALKTSIYIYLVPVITVLTSVIFLHERITLLSAAGIVMTLAGLVLSSDPGKLNTRRQKDGGKNEWN